MQDRLLNAYLASTVDEADFVTKSADFKRQIAATQESLENLGHPAPVDADATLAVFDWAQNAPELW